MSFQHRQRRAHLVRGIRGESPHARREIFQMLQQSVEGADEWPDLSRSAAERDRRQIDRAVELSAADLTTQLVERLESPRDGKWNEQRGPGNEQSDQHDEHGREPRLQFISRRHGLGNLHDHGLGNSRQALRERCHADGSAAEPFVAQLRLPHHQTRRGNRRQITIARQQLRVVANAVVDVVAFRILQHAERRCRQIQRDLAVLGRQGLRDCGERSQEHPIAGALRQALNQVRAAHSEQHGEHDQRTDDYRQESRQQRWRPCRARRRHWQSIM
jgi:hypothetical protein